MSSYVAIYIGKLVLLAQIINSHTLGKVRETTVDQFLAVYLAVEVPMPLIIKTTLGVSNKRPYRHLVMTLGSSWPPV